MRNLSVLLCRASGAVAAILARASGALAIFLVLAAVPLAAEAQHSPSLPSIGLPLPSIGLGPPPWEQRTLPPWERQPLPSWERKQPPPWEGGPAPGQKVDNDHRRYRRGVVPVVQYVPYAVAVPQPPQVIVVQQPPAQVIVVEVPARAPREEAAPATTIPEPPYVPSGDRTLYVIPGCYVGNVPPKNVALPAHCDAKKLTTYNP